MENRLDFERLTELIERKDFRAIKEEMADMYAADAAWILGELEPKEIVLVFRLIPKEEASEVFSYLDIDSQEIIVNAVTDSELSAIMDELYVDDAVDLIEELPAGGFLGSDSLPAADRRRPACCGCRDELRRYGS